MNASTVYRPRCPQCGAPATLFRAPAYLTSATPPRWICTNAECAIAIIPERKEEEVRD